MNSTNEQPNMNSMEFAIQCTTKKLHLVNNQPNKLSNN